ncbi:MAG: hypothetical protein ACKVOP_05275 [Sphingomonadaceae bacterium]
MTISRHRYLDTLPDHARNDSVAHTSPQKAPNEVRLRTTTFGWTTKDHAIEKIGASSNRCLNPQSAL